ncbi:hypothetical protein L1887_23036 [Cichorium endivia]|nr:hypothetical protein L1887_23036 [Cichorium endivia]
MFAGDKQCCISCVGKNTRYRVRCEYKYRRISNHVKNSYQIKFKSIYISIDVGPKRLKTERKRNTGNRDTGLRSKKREQKER